jgi:hypothetical protein
MIKFHKFPKLIGRLFSDYPASGNDAGVEDTGLFRDPLLLAANPL